MRVEVPRDSGGRRGFHLFTSPGYDSERLTQFHYIFDLYSELEATDEVPYNQTIEVFAGAPPKSGLVASRKDLPPDGNLLL